VQSTTEALQSTSRTNQKEEGSSVSNLTLSESEVSDSELSKDLLEDLCKRESIRLLQETMEAKQSSARSSRLAVTEKNTELRILNEKMKEIQGKLNQKNTELNNVNLRVQACQDLLWKTEQELSQTFHSFDTDQTHKMSHELKQKFMSTSRSSEIIKKKISTLSSSNKELDKVLQNSENNLLNLKNELESLKNKQKKLEENNQITLLEINKEVLLSQLNPHSVFNQKTVETFHRELSSHFNQLNSTNNENFSEKVCDLIENSKQKILKFDRKIEKIRKKLPFKKNESLARFKRLKDEILENIEGMKVSKIRQIADFLRVQKLQIREELQVEKMNEFKFLVSASNFEEVMEIYRVWNK
jgi:hypothetical protein